MWTDAAFVERAHAWIGSLVEVAEPIEQTHVQVWSTVMRIPTAHGTVWFKAPGDPTEAALTRLLAGERPAVVPEIVAIHPDLGWMLLRDAGTRLRELLDADPDLRHWETVLAACADLQLAVAQHVERLLAIGVPDLRLQGLADRVAALLEAEEFLLIGEPDGLTNTERDALRREIPTIVSLCSELAAAGIPDSIQHDDLNDGNIFVGEDGYRIMDWGDACVSHPFHTLTVALRATAFRLDLEPGGPEIMRLRDAYLEPFAAFGSRDELAHAADIAYRTGTLARSLAWHSYVANREPADRLPDLESVPYGLQMFLARGPLGAWRAG